MINTKFEITKKEGTQNKERNAAPSSWQYVPVKNIALNLIGNLYLCQTHNISNRIAAK